jgi:hypothetical protein
MRRELFKDYTRADAIKEQEERERLRRAALQSQRNAENSGIIQSEGEGCATCIDGAKSVKAAEQIDICREKYAYLPIYMDVNNQRPSWCPGYACNGTGLAAEPLAQEKNETAHQEEFPL